jgi:hypothetical protein
VGAGCTRCRTEEDRVPDVRRARRCPFVGASLEARTAAAHGQHGLDAQAHWHWRLSPPTRARPASPLAVRRGCSGGPVMHAWWCVDWSLCVWPSEPPFVARCVVPCVRRAMRFPLFAFCNSRQKGLLLLPITLAAVLQARAPARNKTLPP